MTRRILRYGGYAAALLIGVAWQPWAGILTATITGVATSSAGWRWYLTPPGVHDKATGARWAWHELLPLEQQAELITGLRAWHVHERVRAALTHAASHHMPGTSLHGGPPEEGKGDPGGRHLCDQRTPDHPGGCPSPPIHPPGGCPSPGGWALSEDPPPHHPPRNSPIPAQPR